MQKAVQETENKLAMAITENENLKRAVEELRQEIFHLTSQQQLIEKRVTSYFFLFLPDQQGTELIDPDYLF